jgi:hypothetical protein
VTRRRGRRLTQVTLRGMLLLGGVIAAWCACDAVMDDPAYALDEPRPGIVGNLIDGAGTLVDGVISGPPIPNSKPRTADLGQAGVDAVRAPVTVTPGTVGTRTPARGEPHSAVRVPPVDLPPAVTPERRTTDWVAGPRVASTVQAVAPVTRPVVDAVTPVEKEIRRAGLLEPVDAVVRPVAEPILATLAPVLAPVFEVTRPILGQPADPAVPPGNPVKPQPEPAGAAPVTTDPGTARHSAPAPTITQRHPEARPPAPRWKLTTPGGSGGAPATGAATDGTGHPGRVGGTGTRALAPSSTGSATSPASSGAGTATAADIDPHPWTPNLAGQSCASSRCDTFTDRSPQPGTRPA